MPTIREDIAQVRESVKSLYPDVRMHNKYLYNKILDATKLIFRREVEMRKIFRATELFKSLECIEMEYVNIKSCTNILIPGCNYISKSKKKIPESFLSPTGSILYVFNIIQSQQFFQTTPSMYSDIQRREFKGPQRYFWIEDNYLYIPEQINEVLIKGVFINSSELEIFNNTNKCSKLLDSTSFIPQWLREDVFNVVLNSIAGITKRIPADENTNLNANQ